MNRNKAIDIMRGLGILCVVLGHSGIASKAVNFINLFHMALFFMISGYCYKDNMAATIPAVRKYMNRKLKTLYLPYILWIALFSILNNVFIRLNIYTDNPLFLEQLPDLSPRLHSYWSVRAILVNILKGLFLQGSTTMGGAMWFIATLLEISIAFAIFNFLFQIFLPNQSRFILQGFVSLIFLLIGYTFSMLKISFYMIEVFFSCYCLFYMGYLLKYCRSKKKDIVRSIPHAILLIGSFIILLVLNHIGELSLGRNDYVNPLFMLLASVSGWILLEQLSYYILKIPALTKLLCCIGQNTMAVVLLHFLSFKLVNYVGVIILKQPLYYVAAFPVLYNYGFYWIIYTFVGITIPVLLSIFWKKCVANKFAFK